MKFQIGVPRLLPVTIALLGGLLAMKSVSLVRTAVASAPAASTSAPTASTHGTGPIKSGDVQSTGSAAPDSPPTPPPVPAIPESERAVLLELRERRQQLDSREQTVASRESMLAAAEQKLSARVAELQGLQKRLETLETARQQRDDASWQGLVRLYETMKPRDAATIFNDLQMPVLLQVMDRMKDSKAALILSAMNPDKARDVTSELAKLRTQRDPAASTGATSATTNGPATGSTTPPRPRAEPARPASAGG
jgi:flagellar motility protein MotE (MotC chaperone)